RRRLPALGAAVLACRGRGARAGARGGHRLARRARHERRPHAEQPEPALVAPQAVADRPRRCALLPPCPQGGSRPCAYALPADRAARPASVRLVDPRRGRAARAPRRRASPRGRRRPCRTTGSTATTAARTSII